MENIKLHASPHRVELGAACTEVWDAEGDSRYLAGRHSLNLRCQNLMCLAEHRRHPAASPAAGHRRPAVPPPPSCSSSPSSSANHPPSLSNNLQLRVNKEAHIKDVLRNRCEIKKNYSITWIKNNLHMC